MCKFECSYPEMWVKSICEIFIHWSKRRRIYWAPPLVRPKSRPESQKRALVHTQEIVRSASRSEVSSDHNRGQSRLGQALSNVLSLQSSHHRFKRFFCTHVTGKLEYLDFTRLGQHLDVVYEACIEEYKSETVEKEGRNLRQTKKHSREIFLRAWKLCRQWMEEIFIRTIDCFELKPEGTHCLEISCVMASWYSQKFDSCKIVLRRLSDQSCLFPRVITTLR